MEKIMPFLWFDDQAEEAANFYVSVFSKRPGAGTSRVRNITHYGEAGPRPAGMVMTVDLELEGHGITALNGGPEFSFTEAISLAVNCEWVMSAMLQMTKIDIAELERAYAAGA